MEYIFGGKRSKSKTKKEKKVEFSKSKKSWKALCPNNSERKKMKKNCGKKCFLGKKLSYPICSKNTCKVNKKGVRAALYRANQGKNIRGTKKSKNYYNKIIKRAEKLLN